MTVGESLTQARHQAGLSVDELSERTRIRGTVIQSIERDQYDACGGDIYVRGYVRAIAGAVGIDAQPLILEYDQVREAPGLAGAGADLAATRFDLKPFPGDLGFPGDPCYLGNPRYLGSTDFPGDPEATRFDLPRVTDGPPAEDLMAAGYELSPAGITEPVQPALPGQPARTARTARTARDGGGAARGGGAATRGGRSSHRGRGLLIGAAALVALAVIGVIGVRMASSGPSSRNAAASGPLTAAPSATAARTATATRTATAATSAKPAASAQPAVSAKPATSSRSARRPVTALPVTAAQAFGPDGLADGDNPGTAGYAIDGDAPLPWSTQWYATPEFGALKPGTGLLLDLGRPVTITSLRLDLAHAGATLQIRVGDSASPGDLRVVATAADPGGTLRLTLRHPASARYLLVWFTLLPPDGSGHYAESVSRVLVDGRRS